MSYRKKLYRGICIAIFGVFIAIEMLNLSLGRGLTELPGALLNIVKLGLAVLGLFASIFLVIGVHEFGHFFFGRVVGFHLRSMKIGPFTWTKTGKRFKCSFVDTGWTGGYVDMLPKGSHNLLSRYRWHILGGPFASLLLVLLIGNLLPWQRAFTGTPEESLTDLGIRSLFIIGLISSVIAVFWSAVPMTREGWANDAALLRNTYRKDSAEKLTLALKYNGEVWFGKRSRDWDLVSLQKLVEGATSSLERLFYIHNLANGLLYQGRIDEGLARIEEAYDLMSKTPYIPQEMRTVAAQNTSFARAYFGRDLEGAKRALTNGEGYGFYRASAGIALLEGDNDAVRKNVQAAKEWLTTQADQSRDNTVACYEEMDRLQALALPNSR